MLTYGIIMFIFSVVFLWISITIYKGRTDLIHDYHREKVKDNAAYGRAFGKALSTIGITMIVSGIVAILGEEDKLSIIAVCILIAGLIISTICIVNVQKKYNNGIF